MRFWYDTEFIDDGHTIDLISIGIVAEDGREYYAQGSDMNPAKANLWVKEHVFPHLVVCNSCDSLTLHSFSGTCPWRTREQIKHEIVAFMDIEKFGKPELHGWCSAYDHVAFCQLFGAMIDLPQGYPYYTRDLQQVLDERGITDDMLPAQEEGLHNALSDAQHLKKLWGYITRNDAWQ